MFKPVTVELVTSAPELFIRYAVYPLIAKPVPPVFVGAVQLAVTVDPEIDAVTSVGAPGTVGTNADA